MKRFKKKQQGKQEYEYVCPICGNPSYKNARRCKYCGEPIAKESIKQKKLSEK